MRHVTTELYGFTGQGETLKAAREDAQRQHTAAMSGSYDPIIVSFREHIGIGWRNPQGWQYSIKHTSDTSTGPACVSCMGSDIGRSDVDRSIRRHVGQMTHSFVTDGLEAPSVVVNVQDRADAIRYNAWQYGYHLAKQRGMNDQDARDYAGLNVQRIISESSVKSAA